MSRLPSARRVVRFGVFELDISTGELRKQGRKVNLQQQPFQVLALLIRRSGELVTREELQQALWPADTFVEFDQGLNTAIKKIRQALDDSAERPRYVETLPRKGYRFIAAMNEVGSDIESAASPKLSGWRFAGVMTALALAVAATAAAWLLNRSDDTTQVALVPVPLTTDRGAESRPSFSPDGSQVVFDWEAPGAPSEIRMKRIGDGESVRLADGCCPAWSPDGSSIAFLNYSGWLSETNNSRSVFLVSPLGGRPRKLAGVHPGEFSGLAWHPSGQWLVVTDRRSPAEPTALFALFPDSGEKRRLTSPPSGSDDMYPAFSPDGAALLFGRLFRGSSAALYLLDLSKEVEPRGDARRLTPQGPYREYSNEAAWTPEGDAIVFTGGTYHTPALYEVPLLRPGWRPGRVKRLVFAGEGVRMPAISSQGLLAYSTSQCGADIWRLKLNSSGQAAAPPEPLITSTRLDHVPQYSPDGKRIAFASNRSGSHEIWLCNSDGSGAVKLTSMGGSVYTANPSWSPDGRLILFRSSPEGRLGVYVIDASRGTPKLLFEDMGVSLGARIGDWIYLNFQGQVWRRRWPPLGNDEHGVPMTRMGGHNAQESADGKTLYYAKEDGAGSTAIWKVPVEGGQETQVLDSVWWLNFAVAKDGIYFIPEWPTGGQPSIQFLSFATGATTKIVTLSHLPAYGFSLSPDGRSLLYTQYQLPEGDLWMVENFR